MKTKKDIARKMKKTNLNQGNYKGHLNKVYKEEKDFSTRKGE